MAVPVEAQGRRLDQWLAERYPAWSRTQVQGWIRQGKVLVDGVTVRPSLQLRGGEDIVLELPAPGPATNLLRPEPISLDVCYEDRHIAVIDKPAGLQVHPGAGPPRPTLAHALLHRYPDWSSPGAPHRPGIVHRLDRETSGLMVIARSPQAYLGLVRAIARREVSRRYLALVWGRTSLDSGEIREPIGRDVRDRRRMAVTRDGREADTRWRTLRRFDTLSLIDIVLGTGRTHQIRVHLSWIGHPVFGDSVYGGAGASLTRATREDRPAMARRLRRLRRQALHAYHLAFRHPVDGRLFRFETPAPPDIDEVLRELTEGEATA